jgi:hypothetical protein
VRNKANSSIADCGFRIADSGRSLRHAAWACAGRLHKQTQLARANRAKRTQLGGVECAKRTQFFNCGLRISDCGLEAGLRPEPIVRNEPNLGLGAAIDATKRVKRTQFAPRVREIPPGSDCAKQSQFAPFGPRGPSPRPEALRRPPGTGTIAPNKPNLRRRAGGASVLWKRSYGESDMQRASAKQSQLGRSLKFEV